MTARELIIAAPLVVLTVALGIFPQSILGWMSPAVDQVVSAVSVANGGEAINAGGPGPVAAAPVAVEAR